MTLTGTNAAFIGWVRRGRDGAATGRSGAAALVVLVLLLGLAVPARAEGPSPSPRFKLYDDFSRRLLDPARWVSSSACGPTSLECTREIREEALELRVRAYGRLSPDPDSQFASSALALLKDPSATAIAARLQVRATSAAACPSDPDSTHGQALIAGTFFNGGEVGDPDDDVSAYLQLDRFSFEPEGKVRVGGFLSFQGQFFANVELAIVDVREEIVVQLIWDQPGGRFLARLFRHDGTRLEGEMRYVDAVPVVRPAVAPQKTVQANVFVPNCPTGPRPFAEMDVRVRSVLTGTP
jgi:hypothetical protein